MPGPLPRVRLVTHAVASQDPARDIQQIDVASTALTEYPVGLPAGSPGSVRLVKERPGRLELAVATRSRQLLVVSESYHTGWQAVVDG